MRRSVRVPCRRESSTHRAVGRIRGNGRSVPSGTFRQRRRRVSSVALSAKSRQRSTRSAPRSPASEWPRGGNEVTLGWASSVPDWWVRGSMNADPFPDLIPTTNALRAITPGGSGEPEALSAPVHQLEEQHDTVSTRTVLRDRLPSARHHLSAPAVRAASDEPRLPLGHLRRLRQRSLPGVRDPSPVRRPAVALRLPGLIDRRALSIGQVIGPQGIRWNLRKWSAASSPRARSTSRSW
jgi:hypothetical protein